MEIELTTLEGDVMTFFNVDYVCPTKMVTKKNQQVTVLSSGGTPFEVIGNCEDIKRMIRESNMREASLVVNI